MTDTGNQPARIAVIGASGGIGSAFTRQLSASHTTERVYALSRSGTSFADSNVTSHELDFDAEQSIAAAADLVAADGPLDLVIVASGILHGDDGLQPEKTMADIDARKMATVLSANTIGPALVAKHFLPLMRPKQRNVFAVLSARVGSIEDNRLGGWLSYRASKAALNMAIKTLAVEQARKNPQSILVALHPGTVDTGLSQPFTSRVAAGKLFSPEKSAQHLLAVIAALSADASGGFFAWDGQPIPF